MASCLLDASAIKLVSRECGVQGVWCLLLFEATLSAQKWFLVPAGPEGFEESGFGGVS